MNYPLGVSNFLEEISCLTHSVVFLFLSMCKDFGRENARERKWGRNGGRLGKLSNHNVTKPEGERGQMVRQKCSINVLLCELRRVQGRAARLSPSQTLLLAKQEWDCLAIHITSCHWLRAAVESLALRHMWWIWTSQWSRGHIAKEAPWCRGLWVVFPWRLNDSRDKNTVFSTTGSKLILRKLPSLSV